MREPDPSPKEQPREFGKPYLRQANSYTSAKNSRPFLYPKGTRITTLIYGIRADGWVDWNHITQHAVGMWRNGHNMAHIPIRQVLNNLFVTIAFGPGEIIVEVSDRLGPKEGTYANSRLRHSGG